MSDTVVFQHRYITIKAAGDLSSALHQRSNLKGKEEMAVLQKLNSILNNSTMDTAVPKRAVTFRDPIPEPRVRISATNVQ
jgi:hypothetical protein